MKFWPAGVAEQLDHYVYRLIDPRNNQTFYVGKGSGDRVFQHVKESSYILKSEPEEDELSLKIGRI